MGWTVADGDFYQNGYQKRKGEHGSIQRKRAVAIRSDDRGRCTQMVVCVCASYEGYDDRGCGSDGTCGARRACSSTGSWLGGFYSSVFAVWRGPTVVCVMGEGHSGGRHGRQPHSPADSAWITGTGRGSTARGALPTAA